MLKNKEYIYAVYQKKSFSKAAEYLHISQPALSTAVRRVEGELGLPLFDRSSSPIELTEAGRHYIAAVEKVMAVEGELSAQLERIVREQRTVINVGTSSFFCSYALPQAVEEFRMEHPEVSVNLMEVNSGELAGLFRSDILDLCLTVDRVDSKSAGRVWKREEIILAVPARFEVTERLGDRSFTFEQIRRGEHLAADAPRVGLEHFRELPFLFLKSGNDMHDRAHEMCRQSGFVPDVTMYLDQLLTAYYVACSGKGAAFIRGDLVRYVEPTAQVCFFKPDSPLAERDVMLYEAGGELSPIAKEFRDLLLARGAGAGI